MKDNKGQITIMMIVTVIVLIILGGIGICSSVDLMILDCGSNTANSNTSAYCLRVKDHNDIKPDKVTGREYGLLIRPIRLVAL